MARTKPTKEPKAPRKPYVRRKPRVHREKKKFEFFGLPREIRDEIYEQYALKLNSNVTIGEREKAKKPYGSNFAYPRKLEKRKLHVFLCKLPPKLITREIVAFITENYYRHFRSLSRHAWPSLRLYCFSPAYIYLGEALLISTPIRS